jgi:hypothetical protein
MNNPINVFIKKKMGLFEQVHYSNGKRDGRERTFRPNQENCTSLLSKEDYRNPNLWARK